MSGFEYRSSASNRRVTPTWRMGGSSLLDGRPPLRPRLRQIPRQPFHLHHSGLGRCLEVPNLGVRNALRSLVVTAAAMAVGLKNVARGGGEDPVEVKPGDEAPDFTLPGSDGRSYHLRDFRGKRAVVVAWFPKAFTGG